MSRTCAEQSRLREAYVEAIRRRPCMFQVPERKPVLKNRVPFAERRNPGRKPGMCFADVELEVPLEYPNGNTI